MTFISYLIGLYLLTFTALALNDPSIYGFFIDDLRTNTASQFELEAQRWNAVDLVTPNQKVSVCGVYHLGGIGILSNGGYFERTYSNLPAHDIIFFVMKFVLIDVWVNGDAFEIYFDGKKFIYDWPVYQYVSSTATDSCGTLASDLDTFRPTGKFFHTQSSLTVRILSKKTSSSSGAFGFRAINFQLTNKTATDQETKCAVTTTTPAVNTGSFGCGCGDAHYMSNTSTCKSCASNCRQCFGPNDNQCYGCAIGAGFDGSSCVTCHPNCDTCTGQTSSDCASCRNGLWHYWDNTCKFNCPSPYIKETTYGQECKLPCQTNDTFSLWDDSCGSSCDAPLLKVMIGQAKFCEYPCNPSQYLFPNGSCLNTCPAPWRRNVTLTKDFCNYPCSDQSNFYYRSDGICRATCETPFIQGLTDSGKFCASPCLLATDFLYSNGSCKSQCPTVWSQGLFANVKLCNASCSDSTQYFYTSNQTCNPTCAAPLVATQTGSPAKLYCSSPCSLTRILNWNGVCLDECKAPFVLRSYAGIQICYAPCEDASRYYFEESKICQTSCDYPNTASSKNGANFCVSGLTSAEMKKIEQLASMTETGGTAASVGAIIAALLTSGDPGSMGVASLVKMLQYIKLLDIRYPPKLYVSLKLKKIVPSGITFAPKITDQVKKSFAKRDLPENFEAFELHSSFFVNNWEFIFTLGIIITLITLVCLIKVLFKSFPKVQEIMKKVVPALKWNFFLTIFCSNCADIALYSAIEIAFIDLDNLFSVISLFICIGFNALFMLVMIIGIKLTGSLYFIKKKCHATNLTRKLTAFEKKWEMFTMLFQGFHNNSFLQQIYMLLFTMRAYLTNIIVGFFYPYPLAQMIALTILSCCMLLYVVYKRPMTKNLNNIQQMFLEITILIVNVSVLALSIMDHWDIEDPDRRAAFGDVVINTSLAISLGTPIFLVLKLIFMIREQYLERKAKKVAQDKSQDTLGSPVAAQARRIQNVDPSALFSIRLYRNLDFVHASRLPTNLRPQQQMTSDFQMTPPPTFESPTKLTAQCR